MVERFKNWKTTLIGAIAAALIAIGGVLSQTDGADIDYKAIVAAGLTTAIGVFLKDPKKKVEGESEVEDSDEGETNV